MIPSNTICVSQEGPANALALNKDCSQVVIAGRNVFKVFSIGESDFSEVCNLRVGKNLNLNFSSIDVAWSSIEENTLATAATNGAVVVWNLGRSGRSKQEHVFSDHKRTVNKVSFHLTEPALLISGSQDGMMKCFDLRMKEVARTFISNTESIRDVQFSPHQCYSFAAVSENGSVQIWDVRRHERCLQQFTAHSGPVFACDWHPDLPWLATASRDKTIKVWDLHAKPNLEHTIYTIASVGHVKWRPQKKYHVASCALVLDCAVHVWDVRRPHVPLATFAEHRDVTTAIAWQASPHAFLSTSRDCSLYRHKFTEAAHPVLWANPQGVCISARLHVALALPDTPLHVPRARRAVPTHAPPIQRKQPLAGSLDAGAQAALERAFPASAGSVLCRCSAPRSAVLACARLYRTHGAPVAQLAEHNAAVAKAHNRHMQRAERSAAQVSHVWQVVRLAYAAQTQPHAPPPREPPPPPPDPPLLPVYNHAVEEEPMEEVEEWAETQFHNSGVLGLPTHSIYIPPQKLAKQLQDMEEGAGWVSAASAHYVDVDALDWSLPEEAFPHHQPLHAAAPCEPAEDRSPSGGSPPHPPSTPSSTPTTKFNNFAHTNSASSEDPDSVLVSVEASAGRLELAPALAAALRHHAELGDVQTPAVVLLALRERRADLLPYIDEGLQEQWLLGYIELLQRHRLFNVAVEVIRGAWIGSVWALSQQSSSVAWSCGRCGRRARLAACCRPRHDLCAVCHQVVRGLYAWCQGCSHGGHLHHMQQWMEKYQLCPAGCGHHCQLS